jgi:DNA uptake protein ComE-like DNA-binding protein
MPVNKIKSFLFHFFHFNKQERNGIFVLCFIISILFALRLLLPIISNESKQVQFITLNTAATDSLENFNGKQKFSEKNNNYHQTQKQKFVFNPNTVTEEDAQKLGFSKKLSARLVNFRNKGGKFFKPEDLKKLYGLSPKLYNELENYILIPNKKKEYKRDSVFTKTSPNYEKKTYTKALVEINSADSLSIVFLKGIGPFLTKRIINYRSMLGGFHSMNQLQEVYGMTDSLFLVLTSQIQLNPDAVTKIPINAIDFNSLRRHPYFNFQKAQAIINYRSKHGKLNEEDFRGLNLFSDEKLSLILPYLSY